MKLLRVLCALSMFVLPTLAAQESEFSLDVLPSEHRVETDATTGATLIYLSTDPARDTNLYFHERSWLSDSSVILFTSQRTDGGLMGYLTATGELIRLSAPNGSYTRATAAQFRPSLFAVRGSDIIELAITAEPSIEPTNTRSRVTGKERIICNVNTLPISTSLNESCDGKFLSFGAAEPPDGGLPAIYIVNVETGALREVCRVPEPPKFMFHVQWSRTNPNVLSFAGDRPRLNLVDIRDGAIRTIYNELPGELVTHEHWWVNDQILFCGGLQAQPLKDSHLKVIDIHSGIVRIIGAGSTWPGATDAEIARHNYWHCAGSEDGRWIVADNWHGDITIFEGGTTRPYILTTDHRTYGQGDHPHVGWDRKGQQVIFTSHRLGDPNVCIATIPDDRQKANLP